jgi:hypothetical protein
VDSWTVYLIGIAFFFIGCVSLFLFFGGGWWIFFKKRAKSPFSNTFLEPCEKVLSFAAIEKVFRFLNRIHDEYNERFDLKRATICLKTGRIFPNTINRFGIIKIPENYIIHYAKTPLILYASLDKKIKGFLYEKDKVLQGYQTYTNLDSSKLEIEKSVELMKPGPLYLDPKTGFFLGWQIVPGTSLELLVVKVIKKGK